VTLRDLPAANALLNALSAALLLTGYLLIRARRPGGHRVAMLAAVVCSTLFLASYLYYHAQVGSVRFTGRGTLRVVYFVILGTHTFLAVSIVPLVLITLQRALRQRFDRHRRIARITLPLWAYVNVTGVAIYWLLYRL
jgi:uncharacterized membrane protein YozB (DUF420 family)